MMHTMLRRFAVLTLICTSPALAMAGDAHGLVVAAAQRHGVPTAFALNMARAESGVQCGRRNPRSTASGPLQVLKGTARAMGYRGDIRRASCATQTEYGMRALAMCYRGAHGNWSLAKRCHQVGVSVLHHKHTHHKRKRHRH